MLRATWQLLRPGGRTGFYTILPADDLARTDYLRAIRLGPRAVSTRRRSHEEILRAAGFVGVRSLDVTPEWHRTTKQLIAEQDRLAAPLAEIVGRRDLEDRQRSLRRLLEAMDENLLQRKLFTARKACPGWLDAE